MTRWWYRESIGISKHQSIGYGYGWVSEVTVIHRWGLNELQHIVGGKSLNSLLET
jgi:hypothetical protein